MNGIPNTVGKILAAIVVVGILTALFSSAGTAKSINALAGDLQGAIRGAEGKQK